MFRLRAQVVEPFDRLRNRPVVTGHDEDDGLGLSDGPSVSGPDGARATYPPTLNCPIVVIVTG